MILVDTSVWVDHLNAPDATMTARLRTNDVLMHSMVIGELACGNLRAREARIADLKGSKESRNSAMTSSSHALRNTT